MGCEIDYLDQSADVRNGNFITPTGMNLVEYKEGICCLMHEKTGCSLLLPTKWYNSE